MKVLNYEQLVIHELQRTALSPALENSGDFSGLNNIIKQQPFKQIWFQHFIYYCQSTMTQSQKKKGKTFVDIPLTKHPRTAHT